MASSKPGYVGVVGKNPSSGLQDDELVDKAAKGLSHYLGISLYEAYLLIFRNQEKKKWWRDVGSRVLSR